MTSLDMELGKGLGACYVNTHTHTNKDHGHDSKMLNGPKKVSHFTVVGNEWEINLI